MNILDFNLIFRPVTIIENHHWVQCKIAHVFFVFFYTSFGSNCTRVFQTKLNPIENCTRVFFSHCIGSNHVKLHTRF